MTAAVREIAIEHLGKDDMLDVEARAGTENARRETEPVPPGSHGEPILFTLVLASVALKAYVAHLSYKAAMLPEKSISQTVEIRRVDGTIERRELTFEVRTGEHFSDAALRTLTEVPGLAEAVGEYT